ncbi:PPR repeat [Musa troglodytarum]|uniref:PPR repeat n=1 Tax=Musa troglodytarum TaxID=320322 RepID=A0A9E7HNS7_9LILI|nr:PPR repeat [Musa troglodytarum]
MKETGLIPNAVAMLDGLCKDGLIQEAMKLFGSMREKGTMPEVVIYTAAVEGFCKAAKFDEAKRIFRKMQKNGIAPNAFSYKVLIQGLCKGKKLEDSVEFCMEMLDAGHSPGVTTLVDVVNGFCREKGVEKAADVVKRLRERGVVLDQKAVSEHLDKKGPFSPMVFEAISGKKNFNERSKSKLALLVLSRAYFDCKKGGGRGGRRAGIERGRDYCIRLFSGADAEAAFFGRITIILYPFPPPPPLFSSTFPFRDRKGNLHARPEGTDAQSAHFLSASDDVRASFSDASGGPSPRQLSARVFHKDAAYSFTLARPGWHWIGLDFLPVETDFDHTSAVFSVNTDDLVLLHSFTVDDPSKLLLKEYLINATSVRLTIHFYPLRNSVAFVNGIEVVFAPDVLMPDTASMVSPVVGEAAGLSLYAYQMAGVSWSVAKKVSVSPSIIKYPDGTSPLAAPNSVYATAVKMADAGTLNDLYFNVYINGLMAISGLDLSTVTSGLAMPYYKDLVLNASVATG